MSLIRRYWLALLLALLAAVAIFAGVGSATIWRPSDTQTATLPAKAKAQLVTTRAGVLNLYDSDVVVKASGCGQVFLAVGRSTDIAAWSEGMAQVQVNGIDSAGDLKFALVTGKKDVPVTSPAASDMWLDPQTATAKPVSLTWAQRPGQWSVIAYCAAGTPKLSLQWRAPVNTPLLLPLLIAGVVLLAVAAVVAALTLLRTRKPQGVGRHARRLGLRRERQISTLEAEPEGFRQGGQDPQLDYDAAADQTAPGGTQQPWGQAGAEADFDSASWDQTQVDTDLVARLQAATEAPQQEAKLQLPAVPAAGAAVRPSRRQLREARKRGLATIEVEGVNYPTGLVPIVEPADPALYDLPGADQEADFSPSEAADSNYSADAQAWDAATPATLDPKTQPAEGAFGQVEDESTGYSQPANDAGYGGEYQGEYQQLNAAENYPEYAAEYPASAAQEYACEQDEYPSSQWRPEAYEDRYGQPAPDYYAAASYDAEAPQTAVQQQPASHTYADEARQAFSDSHGYAAAYDASTGYSADYGQAWGQDAQQQAWTQDSAAPQRADSASQWDYHSAGASSWPDSGVEAADSTGADQPQLPPQAEAAADWGPDVSEFTGEDSAFSPQRRAHNAAEDQ